MPRDNALTSDTPYEPDLSPEDQEEVIASTNAPSFANTSIQQRARLVTDVEVQKMLKSELSYQEKLDELMVKMDSGTALTEDEVAYIVQRGLIQVVKNSKRSSHRLKALENLTRVFEKKVIVEHSEGKTRAESTTNSLAPAPRLKLPRG